MSEQSRNASGNIQNILTSLVNEIQDVFSKISSSTESANIVSEKMNYLLKVLEKINTTAHGSETKIKEEFDLITEVKQNFSSIAEEVTNLVSTSEENTSMLDTISSNMNAHSQKVVNITEKLNEMTMVGSELTN